jgi:HPt (histidine-containing phosphotransfer) domain-containing protein
MADLENNTSPIDVERLKEVSADDTELMNELIDLYLSQTRELLDELMVAIVEKNSDAIYKSAHKALGSSVTCGMEAVVPPLKQLEHLGREKSFDNAENLHSQAETGFAEIKSYLQENREQLFN